MLSWQSREANSYATASTQGGAAGGRAGSSSSGYGISQLSWPPTVTGHSQGQSHSQSHSQNHSSDSQGTIQNSYPGSYGSHLQHHHSQTPQHQTYQTHGAGPRTVQNSRVARSTPQQQSQPQSLAVLIDPQPRESSAEASDDEEQSEAGSNAHDNVGAEAGNDPEYSPSQSYAEDAETQLQRESARRVGRAAASKTTPTRPRKGRATATSTTSNAFQGNGEDVAENDQSRKARSRLKTYEEVTLFRICNRNADTFGRRSNLCQWWKDVTAQFIEKEGHQYSWHSVRRKVENVMKQRIKFLEDQKNGVAAEDRSNPEWREAVESFVPSWQRWEEAEAGRIETRDAALQGRKRKHRASLDDGGGGGVSVSQTPERTAVRGPRSSLPTPSTRQTGAAPQQQQKENPTAAPASAPTARLPPGFGSMFPPYTPTVSRYGYGVNSPSAPPPPPPPATDGVLAAILETLNRLNDRLDGQGTAIAPASSGIRPALTSTTASADTRGAANGNDTAASLSMEEIQKLKDELRQEVQAELRRELEKDREKIDSMQRTQEMILELLRQEAS